MTDQSADLVTKIDVIPELEGLNSFDAAIERAIAKVNQLDAAIKRVNNLKPASPYAPTSTVSMPSAATTAAVATIAATGANLVSRTPLADTVRKEAQKVARAAVEGTASGITEKISIPASNLYRLPHSNEFGGFLPPPGTGRSGGGFNVPPSGASGWSAGRAGGLLDPQSLRRGPFADMDFSPSRFSGEPLEAKKKPVAEGVEKATRNPFGVDNMLAGAGLTAGIIAAGNALADSLDSVQRQQAQIARLAQTTGDAKDAFFALNAAASDVKSDSGAFISTYTNMATATQKLGLSQEETIKATQGLVGALQLGGAETHTINDALYQMGQAFSSDRFGGDEFRSFMEAIGTMAPKVAEAFGTDVKGLRAMSQAGKLTSEIMIKAFQKMAATNLDLLKKQGWTWGQTMTVMKNDWQAFLAQATIGGEWQKFTDWAANTLIPLARSAEKEVAEFWSTLADESKTAILIGILGAVGAAFTALAIPVMAALWPFLAIGAAIWLVYEAFVEWKAWLNGEGGTIFDGLFGSFDEFERRYPNIVKGLRAIRDGIAGAAKTITQGATTLGEPEGGWDQESKAKKDRYEANDAGGFDVIEKILSLFNGEGHPYETNALGKEQLSKKLSSGLVDPFTLEPITKSGANINNNVNNVTNINVNSAQEAADVRNSLDNPGVINYGSDNLAEGVGAR
ncbi:tape measure protein [Salmonella enterica]|uniref:Tail tape measure protein n=1 Tax=Salmonella newport TaxID=108619 RepID=A0A5Z7XQD5_SALNE|nr:tail tape measure protein [Salmonella enterica]ECS7533511.1 tail tape measure protein [Salmonella enterica subsp. enterica serovar Newport]ECU9528280.1 tail tape measure protein [Salmonella enterica subsp. enterica serovar Sandiego]EAP8455843.1 tail tape measure protein [Salmonella enterica]EAQ8107079.1 tail tape measure protein [Salmonella enterica]